MGNLTKIAVIIMALAMVAAWTVWASDQVNQGEAIEITGTMLKEGRLKDDQGQKYSLLNPTKWSPLKR